MKKVFLIFSMAGCLSLINGINNANAVQSEYTVVTFTCPAGCELQFGHNSSGTTFAYCSGPNGDRCADPTVGIEVDNAISPVKPAISPTDLKPNKMDKVNLKKLNKVSARAGKIASRMTPVVSGVEAQVKAADGGAVAINCPAGCTPNCAIMGNVVLCECKSSDGQTCKAEVVTSDSTTTIK